MTYSFQKTQFSFTDYLRDPDHHTIPASMSPQRMQVYVDMVYNNIEGFISGAFPVLRRIIPDEKWHGLVRDFIKDHQAQTPYFLQISQEFLSYLLQSPHPLMSEFPFMLALAHYEWVELALDVAAEELPEPTPWPDDVMVTMLRISPLTMILSYPWPVHKLSSDFIPATSEDTHLLVYRNRQDQIRFVELNETSSRLLQLCRDNPSVRLDQQLHILQQELGVNIPNAQIVLFLQQLHQSDIVFFYLSSN